MGAATKLVGKIKSIVEDKGFGFIRKDGAGREEKDVFFHAKGLKNASFEELQVGDAVEFDLEDDPRGRGPRAVNVDVR
jgi:CspA family cold shock protein